MPFNGRLLFSSASRLFIPVPCFSPKSKAITFLGSSFAFSSSHLVHRGRSPLYKRITPFLCTVHEFPFFFPLTDHRFSLLQHSSSCLYITPERAFLLQISASHTPSPPYRHPTLPSAQSRDAVTVLVQSPQSSLLLRPPLFL